MRMSQIHARNYSYSLGQEKGAVLTNLNLSQAHTLSSTFQNYSDN